MIPQYIKKWRAPLLLGGAAIIAATALMSNDRDKNRYEEIAQNMEIMHNIMHVLDQSYVDEIDPSKLMRTAIDSMLSHLDPYTNIYSEAEMEDVKKRLKGSVDGIGLQLAQRGDTVFVSGLVEGSPADKRGVWPGDFILKVDNKPVADEKIDDVRSALRGKMGTEVEVEFFRPSTQKKQQHRFVRARITEPNVPYFGMVDDETGYIVLTTFTEQAGSNVENALKTLKENEQLKRVILDLRDNGGGLLMEAINICNIFVEKGKEVVSTRNKIADWDRSFKTQNRPLDTRIPVIVLINGGSASASEIVAGAMQDFDRGILIGKESFGKGLVQNHRDVGYNSKIKLTTAKYYTPSGRCIQELDYVHGRPVRIPDSLRNIFKTRSGRTVYDGGGLEPDWKVDAIEQSSLAKDLIAKHLIFDYATHYRVTHDTIAAAQEFMLTDEDYEAFLSFLKARNYTYNPQTAAALGELENQTKHENYYQAVSPTLAQLRRTFEQVKSEDFSRYKEELMILLEEEIAARYYYAKGRKEVGLQRDNYIDAAIQLFEDKARYNRLLSPN